MTAELQVLIFRMSLVVHNFRAAVGLLFQYYVCNEVVIVHRYLRLGFRCMLIGVSIPLASALWFFVSTIIVVFSAIIIRIKSCKW